MKMCDCYLKLSYIPTKIPASYWFEIGRHNPMSTSIACDHVTSHFEVHGQDNIYVININIYIYIYIYIYIWWWWSI